MFPSTYKYYSSIIPIIPNLISLWSVICEREKKKKNQPKKKKTTHQTQKN